MAELLTEILVAVIAFAMFGSKIRFALDPATRSRSTIGFALFFGLVGISFIFQIDPLYLGFDRLTFANLSWYLSYLAITIGLFFLAEWRNGVEERPWQGMFFTLGISVLTIAIFSIVYWGALRFQTESLNHNIARSFPELVYILVFHSYALFILTLPLTMAHRMWKREVLLAGRLRLGVLVVLMGNTWLWLFLKAGHILTRHYAPDSPLVFVANFFPIFVAVIGIAIAISFFPNSTYVQAARFLDRATDTIALLETLPLSHNLEKICGPVLAHYQNVPFKVQLKRPTLHLRRQVVFLLDCRKLLATYDLTDTSFGMALNAVQPFDDYRLTVNCCRQAGRIFIRQMIANYITGRINALLTPYHQ